jgi:hypothetical protein
VARTGLTTPGGKQRAITLWPSFVEVGVPEEEMVAKQPIKARRGRPRLRAISTDCPVRVELRLTPELARRLFAVADDTGRTVSAVDEAALQEVLLKEQAM